MIVGVPKETFAGERRVALVPALVSTLKKRKLDVIVESGAGVSAGFPDDEYRKAGAEVVSRADVFARADVLTCVRGYGANPVAGAADLPALRPSQWIIGFLDPLAGATHARTLAERRVTAFSMELMPRITRAQSMDALSAMATIAGYKGVLVAADTLPKFFPMLMTAAGSITPARVLVLGAGVAGLQAIATAKRLGAVVWAYDVRPEVKEQVQSVGGKFVELPLETQGATDKGGYAKAQSQEFLEKQQALLAQHVSLADVVITTAAIPGKRAPRLISAAMVHAMKPGSVVVDLAAETGGNCELTRPGETVVAQGVTVLGPVNLASALPYHASQMYARNVTTFLELLVDKEGKASLDMQDEIVRETLVCTDGKVVHSRVLSALGAESTAA